MKWRFNRQRIFIIPTRYGFLFFTSVFILVMVGAAYQNNLVNLVAFFLASIGLVTMVQTHNNLKNIKLVSVSFDPGFAARPMRFQVQLENPTGETRFNLEAEIKGLKPEPLIEPSPELFAHSRVKLSTTFVFKKYGRFELKRLKVSTVYPIGLFYSWIWLDKNLIYFVYPEPKGLRQLPPSAQQHESQGSSQLQNGDDFYEHRLFRRGDSIRHIDWKAYARGRPLLIKRFLVGSPDSLVFDWEKTPGPSNESKLSQLSLWIDLALRLEKPFSLQLPDTFVPTGAGLQHAHHCWRLLAEIK
jgi:uncharacterized protein (DUF58 family)